MRLPQLHMCWKFHPGTYLGVWHVAPGYMGIALGVSWHCPLPSFAHTTMTLCFAAWSPATVSGFGIVFVKVFLWKCIVFRTTG